MRCQYILRVLQTWLTWLERRLVMIQLLKKTLAMHYLMVLMTIAPNNGGVKRRIWAKVLKIQPVICSPSELPAAPEELLAVDRDDKLLDVVEAGDLSNVLVGVRKSTRLVWTVVPPMIEIVESVPMLDIREVLLRGKV